jgi:molybdate transport system substrate-binding protein
LSSFLVIMALAGCACGARPKQVSISVAAAADLRYALDEVCAAYRAQNPNVDVQAIYGSSGNIYSHISNKAPYDVFLSADVEYVRRLAREGFVDPGEVFVYAVGRIVVWAPASSPLDVAALRMRALAADSVKHVAIADPQHAPYGRAAEAAMRSAGVYDAAAPKLVYGENIAQTLEFVESGAADVGIVALSLALAPQAAAKGKFWEVPLDAYPRLEQGGAVLKSSKSPEAARAFVHFLRSGKGAETLRRYGFSIPGK